MERQECTFCGQTLDTSAVRCGACGRALTIPDATGAAGTLLEEEVMDLLGQLVERSLVVFDESDDGGRYRLLESVREYGLGMLKLQGESELLADRHREYFTGFAEAADSRLGAADQAEWLRRLDREHDNLRQALDSPAEVPVRLRLLARLGRFWITRGYLKEGRDRAETLLATGEPAAPTDDWAAAVNVAGALALSQGDLAAATRHFERSLRARRKLGDLRGESAALGNLALIKKDARDYAASRRLEEQSLKIRRRLGDMSGIATSLSNLGMISYDQRDYTVAVARFRESLALYRQLGNRRGMAICLDSLGLALTDQKEFTAAESAFAESAQILTELGDRGSLAEVIRGRALLAYLRGDYGAARACLAECLPTFRSLGQQHLLAEALVLSARVSLAEGRTAAAAESCLESAELFCLGGADLACSDPLIVLGDIASRMGLRPMSVELLAAAYRLSAQRGSADGDYTRFRMQPTLDRERVELGETAFARAWASGETLTLDHLLTRARGTLAVPQSC